jgi:hypothetical protein
MWWWDRNGMDIGENGVGEGVWIRFSTFRIEIGCGICECCDEPSGSSATGLVNIYQTTRFNIPEDILLYKLFGHLSVRSLWQNVLLFVKTISCDVVYIIVLTSWLRLYRWIPENGFQYRERYRWVTQLYSLYGSLAFKEWSNRPIFATLHLWKDRYMMLAKVTGVSCQSHSKGSDFIICVDLGSPVGNGTKFKFGNIAWEPTCWIMLSHLILRFHCWKYSILFSVHVTCKLLAASKHCRQYAASWYTVLWKMRFDNLWTNKYYIPN